MDISFISSRVLSKSIHKYALIMVNFDFITF